jgi:hypothetical protein
MLAEILTTRRRRRGDEHPRQRTGQDTAQDAREGDGCAPSTGGEKAVAPDPSLEKRHDAAAGFEAARGTNVAAAECSSPPLQAEATPLLGAEYAPESAQGSARSGRAWVGGATPQKPPREPTPPARDRRI